MDIKTSRHAMEDLQRETRYSLIAKVEKGCRQSVISILRSDSRVATLLPLSTNHNKL